MKFCHSTLFKDRIDAGKRLAKELEFISLESFGKVYFLLQEVMKMLNSLISKVKSSA